MRGKACSSQLVANQQHGSLQASCFSCFCRIQQGTGGFADAQGEILVTMEWRQVMAKKGQPFDDSFSSKSVSM